MVVWVHTHATPQYVHTLCSTASCYIYCIYVCTGHGRWTWLTWLTQWWMWAMLLPWQHQTITINFNAADHAQWPVWMATGSQVHFLLWLYGYTRDQFLPNSSNASTYVHRQEYFNLHTYAAYWISPQTFTASGLWFNTTFVQPGMGKCRSVSFYNCWTSSKNYAGNWVSLGLALVWAQKERMDWWVSAGVMTQLAKGVSPWRSLALVCSLSLFPSSLSPSCVQALHFVSHFCHINITSADVTSLSS